MNSDPLDDLLEVLDGSDEAAAEQAYRTYEPLLRMLVRRCLTPQLRARFDSVDVIQSVWADLLDGLRSNRWRFTDASQFRGFLVRVTRNRLIDRVRQHQSAIEYERAPAGVVQGSARPQRGASPSEFAQAEELWERMLAVCGPDHHKLLMLRRQGFTTAEIASQVGLHEGSVRRILGDLARRLAIQSSRHDAGSDPGLVPSSSCS
jgi:RNA polymerase sigma-70 factor (ECF subfamily)